MCAFSAAPTPAAHPSLVLELISAQPAPPLRLASMPRPEDWSGVITRSLGPLSYIYTTKDLAGAKASEVTCLIAASRRLCVAGREGRRRRPPRRWQQSLTMLSPALPSAAVDLVSPLAAWKVVTWALKQESPRARPPRNAPSALPVRDSLLVAPQRLVDALRFHPAPRPPRQCGST